jgi:hypothetical protein
MSWVEAVAEPLRTARRASAVLTGTAMVMMAVLAANLLGLLLDPRVVTGAPVWLKPAKFALSTAIYMVTLAWLIGQTTVWPRATRAIAWTTALVLIGEIALVDLQAWRGTTSHFNDATAFDAAVFGLMGAMILVLWLASVVLLAALLRQPYADRVWGWALRIGLLVTIVGSASGGFMLSPRPEQALTGPRPNGGHTIGAPDGTPGLPVTNWSMSHGDLRIPHFVGLHGVQAIPLLVWLTTRRRRAGIAHVAAIGVAYIGLITILTAQAFRGQSIVAPDGVTLGALAIWLLATILGYVVLTKPRPNGASAHPSHPASAMGVGR